MEQVPDKSQPISKNLPFVTYVAIEGAFKSGAFYAKHRVGCKSLAVELLSFGMEGNVENVIPFAVATTVAIYDAIAGIRDYTENDLSGWDVVSIVRS